MHNSTSPKLHIGITIGLQHATETLWNNGIKQNAVFLAEALKHCPNVATVRLVNTTAVPLTDALPWDLARWPTVDWDAAKDTVDVLIELGGQCNAAQTQHLHARGARLVSYCCGSEYVQAIESMLFNRPQWGSGAPFINPQYDDIWVIPQVARLNLGYFSTLRRRAAQVVPFVWDPVFLEQRAQAYPHAGCYQAHPGARRLSVMEPNINVVKFCLYPALIAEQAYRQQPQRIELLQVTNAETLATHNTDFIALMGQLDIVREHKAVFLGRHDTPSFLAERTDIVISHQWENALNYFYLEVCWQGYALIHNADLCADLGYYYPEHDLDAGAAQLLSALHEHDAHAEAYRTRQRAHIARFQPGNAHITATYSALLDSLF